MLMPLEGRPWVWALSVGIGIVSCLRLMGKRFLLSRPTGRAFGNELGIRRAFHLGNYARICNYRANVQIQPDLLCSPFDIMSYDVSESKEP